MNGNRDELTRKVELWNKYGDRSGGWKAVGSDYNRVNPSLYIGLSSNHQLKVDPYTETTQKEELASQSANGLHGFLFWHLCGDTEVATKEGGLEHTIYRHMEPCHTFRNISFK